MPQKILVLSPWYPTVANPAMGIFIQEQSALIAEDFDVRVMVGKPKQISILNFLICKLKTKYLNLSLESKVVDYEVYPPKAYEVTYYHSESLEVQHNLYLIKECFKTALTHLIEKENWKPDLIHAHVTNNGGIIGNYLGKIFDVPVIITEHTGNFLLHKHSFYLSKLMIKTLNEAEAVLAVGNKQKQLMYLHEISRSIEVVGNMVDETKFIIEDKLKIDKFHILTITRSSYEKDLKTFIYAIGEIIALGHKDISVTIILGTSKEKTKLYEDYEQICENLQIKQFCHFHYIVPRHTILAYYQNCDVFVSSSIVESFGVAICEAISCGKPVVSTDNGGVGDIITPQNGIIVPIQDHKTMAAAILKIKNKEIIFEPEEVRNSIIYKFGREGFKNRIKEIYKHVFHNYKNK